MSDYELQGQEEFYENLNNSEKEITKNILVTDFQDSGEDVMVFTSKFTVEQIEQKLEESGAAFNEIYEVKDKDLQYYIYEPCHLDFNKF